MTVKVLKAINGEDIIANVKHENETEFKVEDPAVIVLQQTERGVGVSIAPYMPYAKNIFITKSGLVAVGDPDTNLENEYNRIFGSGIVVAPAGSIK